MTPEGRIMNTPNGKEWKWLYHYSKSNYKQLSVKGTRIHAGTIYGFAIGDDAETPEELARNFNIPVEAVREAIEYCESNPPEIQEDWEMEERSIREWEDRDDPNFWGPKRVAARLKELGTESNV
jgi:hypothetical protein